jgi:hypothetical protein
LRECRIAFSRRAWEYFIPLVVGLVLADSAKLCSNAYEFSSLARHWTGHYRFFSAYVWCPITLARIVLRLIVSAFGAERCQLVVDDTFVLKTGKKIFGVNWHGDYRPGSTWCRWAHNWVVIGVSVRFPALKRWLFFPLGLALYVRKKYCPKGREFKTRHVLAAEMIESLQGGLKTPLDVAADGAYATRDLMRTVESAGSAFVSRMRKDAEIYDPVPGPYKGVGRRALRGKRLPAPDAMARKGVRDQPLRVMAYGRWQTVQMYTRLVWWKARRGVVRLVIVTGINRSRKPAFLYSTDPDMTPREIIEQFSGRWPIEQGFRDGKQLMGFGQTQMRGETAISRFTAFGLIVHSLVKLWYIREHGVGVPNHVMPWYRHKTSPSFLDMLKALQRRLRGGDKAKLVGRPPQPAKLSAAARPLRKTGTNC